MDSDRTPDGRFRKGHSVRKPPSVKKIAKLAEAEETGRLKAQLKAHQKKPFMEEVKEHLGKMIDRIDPLKSVIIGATSVVIFTTLKQLPNLKKTIDAMAIGEVAAGGVVTVLASVFFPPAMIAGLGITSAGLATGILSAGTEVIPKNDIILMCLSLMIAWVIVEHGADILHTAGSLEHFATDLIFAGI